MWPFSSSSSAHHTALATAIEHSYILATQTAKASRLANRLLQATGLELEDICDVPENCRLLLAPAARGRWHRHRIQPGNGNDAQEVICRLVRFVVKAKERERAFISEVAVLHELVDGEEGRLCRVGSSQRAGGEKERPCEVSGKWARVEERGGEVKAWVEEVTELASLAGGLLEWNGSTGVDLENDGAVRRRRTYGGGS